MRFGRGRHLIFPPSACCGSRPTAPTGAVNRRAVDEVDAEDEDAGDDSESDTVNEVEVRDDVDAGERPVPAPARSSALGTDR